MDKLTCRSLVASAVHHHADRRGKVERSRWPDEGGGRSSITTAKAVAKWIVGFRNSACIARSLLKPVQLPSQTPPDVRRSRGVRPAAHTGKQIAAGVGVSAATVSRILTGFTRTGSPLWIRPNRAVAASGNIRRIDPHRHQQTSANSIALVIALLAIGLARAIWGGMARGRYDVPHRLQSGHEGQERSAVAFRPPFPAVRA